MQRAYDHPLFRQECSFTDTPPERIESLVHALRPHFGALRIGRIELSFVRSATRARLHSSTIRQFSEAWRTNREQLREIDIYICDRDMRAKALVNFVYLAVHQTLRTKEGEPHRRLALGAGGCSHADFERYLQVARASLQVELAPPPGSTWDRERLKARWRREHVDPVLVEQISGAVDACQFDTALRTAVALVESRLRAKCIEAGKPDAAGKSGVELAEAGYHEGIGCLRPPWAVANQAAQGAHLLFRGFFLYLRNAFAHETHVMADDESAVYDLLATCEFLLKVVDRSVRR